MEPEVNAMENWIRKQIYNETESKFKKWDSLLQILKRLALLLSAQIGSRAVLDEAGLALGEAGDVRRDEVFG